jgi:hypothetical protein
MVVEPCAMMAPNEGYARARKLLCERFGDDYKVAVALMKQVCQGPVLKGTDVAVIQDFADDVSNCAETLSAMGKMKEIDTNCSNL